MIGNVSAKYAIRSLLRHPRRSLLSVLGVGIGCALALFGASWISGSTEMQIRAISESGGGHLRVVHQEWPDTREDSLRLVDGVRTLEVVRALPGVKSCAMRARTKGLLAMGNRTAGAEVTGVIPEDEMASNRIVNRAAIEGRYLQSDDTDKVVIGRVLAKRLGVEVDDDLYVTLVGANDIQSAMLTIVGIIQTGSRDLDAMVCQVTLADIERLTGCQGAADISILLDDYRLVETTQRILARQVSDGNVVITWKEVNPGLAGNVEGDRAFTKGLLVIIVLLVSLGIVSAQLTAVLERRSEFAILSALGMKGRQVVGLVVLEAVVVGLAGAALGLALGGTGAYFLSTRGVGFESFMGDDASFGDVLIDPRLFGDFGPWLISYALVISLVATVAASIYPAWLATRIDPARALRKG
jgi:ABC-type lipoprotein release transport system permease subunit